MFMWLNKQGVRSDFGFEVQRTGRFDAEYREGSDAIRLYVESGMHGGMPCIIVDPDAFSRWDDGRPIAPDKQIQILRNFKDAMAFQDLNTVVEKGNNESIAQECVNSMNIQMLARA